MNADASKDLAELETRWRVRERKWARRLGRLRLGVEPLEEQLTRYRRTTWVLAVVPGIIALMFLTLFTVFGRPDIGFVVILILFVPMILFAWVGYARLKRRAAAYLADRARFEDEKKRLLEPRSRRRPRDRARDDHEVAGCDDQGWQTWRSALPILRLQNLTTARPRGRPRRSRILLRQDRCRLPAPVRQSTLRRRPPRPPARAAAACGRCAAAA